MEKQTPLKSSPAPISAPVAAAAADRDLSGEIERAVVRERMDRVHCVRVFADFYRCNWWAPAGGNDAHRNTAAWAEFASNRVRKSSFLSATLRGGQLTIEEVDSAGGRVTLATVKAPPADFDAGVLQTEK